MVTETIILAIISAIGGGSLGAYLNFRLKRDENKVNESFNLISYLTEEIERQKTRIQRLEVENHELASRIRVLESTAEDFPFPMWHKDISGTYLWVNEAFVDKILIPKRMGRADIIGKKDTEVWPEEITLALRKLETESLLSNNKDSINLDFSFGDNIKYAVYKYPIFVYRTHVGWAGIALHIPTYEN